MSVERQSLVASASVAALAIALLSSGQVSAAALPTKGHFAAGEGVIGKANQSLTVKQSSTTGIIDWNSFSIGKHSGVSFDNGSGATLNRVTGGNLSRIAGSLHATGSLYLMNNAGVIVSGTGHVVTGGNFVASSGNIANTAFGTDDLRIRDAKAAVVNHGTITAGGNASLVGGTATNTGSVTGAHVTLSGTHGVMAAGTIHATGNAKENARVLVIAKDGETKIRGDLVARNADGTGGRIETSGRHLSLGGTIDAGSGGHWVIDPVNLTVKSYAANKIDAALNAGTDVTLKTTRTGANGPGVRSSGSGDIVIDHALSWGSGADLKLQAYHSILVDSTIDVTGSGGVNLDANTSDTDGHLLFQGGRMTFADLSSALTIDGYSYTLVNNVATLANDIANDESGNFALANNYDASADGTYSGAPIHGTFQGAFEGLGNTISNLSIKAKSDPYVGLFSYIGFNGLVENLNLANAHVVGGGDVGALAGISRGIVANASSSGTVDGGVNSYIGGLVGQMEDGALLVDSSSSAHVYARGRAGRIGGLVGNANSGSAIENSMASGKVRGGRDANVGGLLGAGNNATVIGSYATGDVSDSSNGNTGGLVGRITDSSIRKSFATGAVSGSDGAWVGGLLGYNENGLVSNAYATGDVSGGKNANVGGLVGTNTGKIRYAYSTGAAAGGAGSFTGGFAGEDEGSILDSYWDVTTSGLGTSQGAGNVLNDPGITGLTTAQLQASLPTGFSSAIWNESATVNGGLPYLIGVTPA